MKRQCGAPHQRLRCQPTNLPSWIPYRVYYTLTSSRPAPAAAHSAARFRTLKPIETSRQDRHTNPLPTASHESEFSASDDDTACDVCGITSNAPAMLLCDTCDQGFHLYCLSPPLPHVQSGKWYCPECTAAHAQPQLLMKMHRIESAQSSRALTVLILVTTLCPPRVWLPVNPTIAPRQLSLVGLAGGVHEVKLCS